MNNVPVSPCASCAQKDCNKICKTWEEWFCKVWRRIRETALGKDN